MRKRTQFKSTPETRRIYGLYVAAGCPEYPVFRRYLTKLCNATNEYLHRKAGGCPPGSWVYAGKRSGGIGRVNKFCASEQTSAIRCCRAPSRTYPLTEFSCAKTAAHVAEVFGVSAEQIQLLSRYARKHLRDQSDRPLPRPFDSTARKNLHQIIQNEIRLHAATTLSVAA